MDLKKKRAVFTVDEIEILIQLWGDSNIQKKFGSSVRHNIVWEEIASQMRSLGFDRTAAEIKSKINNLKTEYRKIKPASGSSTPDWPYFQGIHCVLGQRDVERDDLVDDSYFNELPMPLEVMVENTMDLSVLPSKRPRMENRVSTIDQPGISGLQRPRKGNRVSTIEEPGTSGIKSQESVESQESDTQISENEVSQEPANTSIEEPEQPSPRTFKRIPWPSQKKIREVDQILNFLKSSEERQNQQIDTQNALLQNLIAQEEAANQRDDRVAEAFINTLNIMSKTLLKQNKKPDMPSFRPSSMSPPLPYRPPSMSPPLPYRPPSISPPLRIPSPTSFHVNVNTATRPTYIAQNMNQLQPRILYISSPLTRSPLTQSPLPSPDPCSDPLEDNN